VVPTPHTIPLTGAELIELVYPIPSHPNLSPLFLPLLSRRGREGLLQEIRREPDALLIRHIEAVVRPVVGVADLLLVLAPRELPKEHDLGPGPAAHAPRDVLEVVHYRPREKGKRLVCGDVGGVR
jgi:hypothetical protein